MKPVKLCSDIIDEKDINSLICWLRKMPQLTKGAKTVEFEEKFSEYLGCKHSIYCNSGSSANLLIVSALKQMGLLKNSKIVVPQVSWSTTIFPAIQFGLDPILCDCNMENLGLDVSHLKEIIAREQPAAVMLVHVLGLDSSIEEIIEICDQNNVLVIEDTCESLGSRTSDKMLGTFGFASSFSFYFGHHISTIEGGMVCTDNSDFADVVKMIRSHGWDRDLSQDSKEKYRQKYGIDDFDSLYKFYYAGFNLRATDLQAFIGLNQIPKINHISKTREENYYAYCNNLNQKIWFPKPKKTQEVISNMGFPLILENKQEVYRELNNKKIECRPLVAGSMGLQPAWVNLYGEEPMANANIVEKYGMYIPNHQDLRHKDIKRICSIINRMV